MLALLIKNGFLVTDPLTGAHQTGDLLLEGGRITQVGSIQPFDGVKLLDAKGGWVVPGLTDAHTHMYGFLANGMPSLGDPPQTFPQILERVWWRLDKALNADDIEISGLLGGVASLRSGITTVFDHHASPTCVTGSLDILSEALERVGLRAAMAYEVSDRDGAVSRDRGIEENQRFIQHCQTENNPMRKAHFGLHAVFSLSDATLRSCAEIGNSLGAGFHLHVVEHRTELEKFRNEHDGLGVVPFLAKVGILNPKTIAAHVVHVNEQDIELLTHSGTWTVHNPKSNMGNGVGVSPIGRLLEAGVSACLGSDGFYDIPRQMELVPLLQNLHNGNPSSFGTDETLQMVYGNNARLAEQTFGMPFGKLAAGYAADCLVIPYEPETPVNSHNFSGHLLSALLSGPAHVIVGGAQRIENGVFRDMDIAAIRARSKELAEKLWKRL